MLPAPENDAIRSARRGAKKKAGGVRQLSVIKK
jgi:hypothetical protein